jgi:hypothetical protein
MTYKKKVYPINEQIDKVEIVCHIGASLSPLLKNLWPGILSLRVQKTKFSASFEVNNRISSWHIET